MLKEGYCVKDEGGVVGLIPKANRNAIDECFSAKLELISSDSVSRQNLTKHLDGFEKQREEKGCGVALGSPPQAIRGHYRLLSDIQYIFTLRYCTTEGFLQH